MTQSAYDIAVTLAASRGRHPGLDWVVVPHLDRPYLIERNQGGVKVYIHGGMSRTLADAALLAAIAELDQADCCHSGGCSHTRVTRAATAK